MDGGQVCAGLSADARLRETLKVPEGAANSPNDTALVHMVRHTNQPSPLPDSQSQFSSSQRPLVCRHRKLDSVYRPQGISCNTSQEKRVYSYTKTLSRSCA
jgi:hypothetical protein